MEHRWVCLMEACVMKTKNKMFKCSKLVCYETGRSFRWSKTTNTDWYGSDHWWMLCLWWNYTINVRSKMHTWPHFKIVIRKPVLTLPFYRNISKLKTSNTDWSVLLPRLLCKQAKLARSRDHLDEQSYKSIHRRC